MIYEIVSKKSGTKVLRANKRVILTTGFFTVNDPVINIESVDVTTAYIEGHQHRYVDHDGNDHSIFSHPDVREALGWKGE